MSSTHSDLANALLEQLEQELARTQGLMDQLTAEMDKAKYSGSIEQSAEFRRRFIEITEQQRRLGERFARESAALDGPSSATKQ